jgi:hypothetical protein
MIAMLRKFPDGTLDFLLCPVTRTVLKARAI